MLIVGSNFPCNDVPVDDDLPAIVVAAAVDNEWHVVAKADDESVTRDEDNSSRQDH